MYVSYVVTDDLKQLRQTQEFEGISWEKIEGMIQNLDGERYTHLIMYPSKEEAGEYCFGIRAAKKAIYVCNYYDGDEYYLINPKGEDFPKTSHIGEFAFDSSTEFTGIEDTTKAAKVYFEKGLMDSTLEWAKV
jgi:hypothetical protein